jgi:hypothetical protein
MTECQTVTDRKALLAQAKEALCDGRLAEFSAMKELFIKKYGLAYWSMK